ncbi:hypothetical protein LLE49_01295 [Alicyclobacillus tolerans]|uniref:hypothetical protein n=1 Tax=Alicyclobacillus tolerans TaxID=90970 RepID=UPI001F35FCB5|nr:hypothetical protein [Alicyclobacillus tolerans]MCF8563379.1 hypothetical protein [Alicyclobacillus tolerans]
MAVTRGQCMGMVGQWVRFTTPWGVHQGVIAGVNNRAVLVRVPRRYAPALMSHTQPTNQSDSDKLDLALTQYGYGYGGGWGYPGYGGWYGGWWWWWLAFP